MPEANSATAPNPNKGIVIGVRYVRIPAPDLDVLAEFYKKSFGMSEIGRVLDHGILLNGGATPEEATLNKNVRIILDNRLTPNDENPLMFVTRDIESVVRRAEKNGATIIMEPFPIVSRLKAIVGKMRDPAGNWLELMEEGSLKDETLSTAD